MSATPRFTESELSTKEVQAIIARRKKQIHYGKVLDCYHRYNQVVPRYLVVLFTLCLSGHICITCMLCILTCM